MVLLLLLKNEPVEDGSTQSKQHPKKKRMGTILGERLKLIQLPQLYPLTQSAKANIHLLKVWATGDPVLCWWFLEILSGILNGGYAQYIAYPRTRTRRVSGTLRPNNSRVSSRTRTRHRCSRLYMNILVVLYFV